MGELLTDKEKNKGQLLRGNTMQPRDNTETLEDLGISKIQSFRLANDPYHTSPLRTFGVEAIRLANGYYQTRSISPYYFCILVSLRTKNDHDID